MDCEVKLYSVNKGGSTIIGYIYWRCAGVQNVENDFEFTEVPRGA